MSIKKMEYLTKKQIEVLLKYYYLKKYTTVATDENITPSQVKRIKDDALRIIRLAYSKLYKNNLHFDGEAVLHSMAERSNLEVFVSYMVEGLASADKKYWERITGKSEQSTPAELLNFLYAKFEIDITGFI